MNNLIILLIAVLPVYLIALFVYNKDKDKESRKLLTKLFFMGMFSCLPAIVLEILLGIFFGDPNSSDGLLLLFIKTFICIALVEEICKWYFTYKITYKHEEFDHVYDAVVYAVFVSLGFALFENIFYVFLKGITVGLFRAITAVPGHAIYAIIMGEYLGIAKVHELNGNHKKSSVAIFLSVLMPAIAHALYDYCLLSERIEFIIIFFIFLVIMYVIGFKKIKSLSNVKYGLYPSRVVTTYNYCPHCGNKASSPYCPYCGNKLNNNS